MTPTTRAAQHPPAVVDAWHWIKTYCRHWATTGHDWQTIDNITPEQRPTAERHLQTLREAGLLVEGGFRGNFEVREL